MSQYQLNEQTVTEVAGLKGRVECVDAQGVVLGYFEPAEFVAESLRRRAFAAYDAEGYRRHKEATEGGPTYTTEQVLEQLRSIEVAR